MTSAIAGMNQEAMFGRKKLLLVDDNLLSLEELQQVLRADYELFTASGGRESLVKAGSVRPDLILLDVLMPDMDGYEVMAALKNDSATRDIPVIFITARTDADSEVLALSTGAVDFIHKPIKEETVRARVRLHLELAGHREHMQAMNRRLEQSLADTRLAQSRLEILSTAIEQSPTSVLITGADALIQYVNPRFTQESGYSADEAIGQNPRMLNSGLTDPALFRDLWHHLRRGEPWSGTFTNRRKSGEIYWEEAHIAPVKDTGGRTTHYVGVKLDISDRLQAEEQLRLSEARLHAITDSALDAILMMDPQGNISYWNPAAERILGYSADEVLGKNLHDLLVPERYHADHHEALPEFLRTGCGGAIGKTRNVFALRKDGQEIAVSISLSSVMLNDAWNAVGILRDITQRLQEEEALRQSEERVRLLLNSTGEAIYGIDLQGRCTFANASCLKMLGYTGVEQMLGRNIHQLIHHSYPDGMHFPVEACSMYEAFQEGRGVHRDDVVYWRADGTGFPVEVWSHPQIMNGEVTGAVITFIDITERKQAELALRQSEDFTRATLDAIMANICVLDERGVILAVNQKWRDFADANQPIPANYGVGTNYLAVCAAAQGEESEEARRFARGIMAVLAEESSRFDLEEYACHSVSEQRWFHARVTRFAGSGPVRLVVSHENITERKLAQAEILEKNATLEREKNLAHGLLKTVLPEKLQIQGFRTAVFYKPSDKIGGDFFDGWSDGNHAHFLVGDISGHSTSAALLMAVCKGLFMSIGKEQQDPSGIVATANRTLSRMLLESGMYLTMIYVVCDIRSRVVRVVSAGHNPAYLYSSSGRTEIESTGPPIGWDPDDSWSVAEYPFVEGDKILLYTDGLVEIRSPAGRYCELDLFATVDASFTEEGLVGSVLNRAETFCDGAFDDDLTLFAIGYDASGTGV